MKYTLMEMKEKTAAGLRAVAYLGNPVALVAANGFIPDDDLLCGYHVYILSPDMIYRPYSDFDCQVYPIYTCNINEDDCNMDTYKFARAFADYNVGNKNDI